MTYFKPVAFALVLGFGATQLAACVSQPTASSRTTGRFVDDAGLTAKVKTALARDPDVSALDVNVTTYRGVVQLSGFVDSENQVRKAADVAHGIAGVKDVINDVRVKPRG